MSEPAQGTAVEDYARRLAGGMGVPDFVYEPVLVQRRGGSREISGGLLVARDRRGHLAGQEQGASRWRGGDSEDRAKAWCVKLGDAAQRHGVGTRSSLPRSLARVRSLRGFERVLPDGADCPVQRQTSPEPGCMLVRVTTILGIQKAAEQTARILDDSAFQAALKAGRDMERALKKHASLTAYSQAVDANLRALTTGLDALGRTWTSELDRLLDSTTLKDLNTLATVAAESPLTDWEPAAARSGPGSACMTAWGRRISSTRCCRPRTSSDSPQGHCVRPRNRPGQAARRAAVDGGSRSGWRPGGGPRRTCEGLGSAEAGYEHRNRGDSTVPEVPP